MQIREATARDQTAIRDIHLAAFPDGEGAEVARLAVGLLAETSEPATLSLVAEANGALVGHLAFSPVTLGRGGGPQGYILAPLGVRPAYQRRGVGRRLIETGLTQLAAAGVALVFVYGDPAYYGRFGFSAEAADGYQPPYPLSYPFGWQARALSARRGGAASVAITCVAPLCDPALW